MSVEAAKIQIHVTRVSKGRQFEDMAISEVTFLPVESSHRSLNKIFDAFRSKDYEAIVSSSTRTEDLSQKFYHFRLGSEPVKFTAKPDTVYSRLELSSTISSTRGRPSFPYFARIAGEEHTHVASNEHSFFNHVRDSFIGSSVVFFERDSQQFLIGSGSFQYGTSEWLESYPALAISRDGKIDRGWEINRPGAVPGCEHVLPHPDSIASYSGMQPPLSPF